MSKLPLKYIFSLTRSKPKLQCEHHVDSRALLFVQRGNMTGYPVHNTTGDGCVLLRCITWSLNDEFHVGLFPACVIGPLFRKPAAVFKLCFVCVNMTLSLYGYKK